MHRLLARLALVSLAACGDDGTLACRVGADCASGVCRGDGTCAPIETSPDANDTSDPSDSAGLDAADATVADTDALVDVGDTSALDTGDATPGVCVLVDDDRVSRAEMPLRSGLYATFRIAGDVDVDLVGAPLDGQTAWDLEGPYTGDADVRVDLQALTGQWFAADFPGATYAARLSTDNDYLGVFEVSDTALLLRGVVSPEESLFPTKLVYDHPPVVYAFPLAEGDTWTSEATVTGTTLGVPTYLTEKYVSQVDAGGTLATPFGDFDVLRVRTTLTRTLNFIPTTTRQMAFVAPCFGTVALVVSDPGEPEAEFDHAAELRRLAP